MGRSFSARCAASSGRTLGRFKCAAAKNNEPIRRQRAQLRKANKRDQAQQELIRTEPQVVPVLAPELIQSQAVIEQYVQSHTSKLETVTQNVQQILTRLSGMDRQLTTTQAERLELSQQFQQNHQQITSMQRDLLALVSGLHAQLQQPVTTEVSRETRVWQSNVESQLAELQATLLTLDDIKSALQTAVEQNRVLKSDLDAQPQKLFKQLNDSIQSSLDDVKAQLAFDPQRIGQTVGDKVCDNLRDLLGTRFTKEVAQQLSDSLNNEFALPLTGQLRQQLSGELNQHIAKMVPPTATPLSSDDLAQSVRATLVELLTPWQDSLQNNLQLSIQQSIQQSVQQAVDASLQQTVEQTLAPMIEATTSAQIRAAVAPLQSQMMSSPATSLPIASAPSYVSPVNQAPVQSMQPMPAPMSYEVSHEPAQATHLDSPAIYEGHDSQPYVSPSFNGQAYAAPPAVDEPMAQYAEPQAQQVDSRFAGTEYADLN